jgi:hypothetical protein
VWSGNGDIASAHEAITPADFFEHCQKQIATLRASQPGLPMVRKSVGDGWTPSQLTRAGKKAVGRRPRRPHLYEKREGGASPAE